MELLGDVINNCLGVLDGGWYVRCKNNGMRDVRRLTGQAPGVQEGRNHLVESQSGLVPVVVVVVVEETGEGLASCSSSAWYWESNVKLHRGVSYIDEIVYCVGCQRSVLSRDSGSHISLGIFVY